MTTYLNVPFCDKAEAKAKGARWDSETRKWFVPIGRDLEPFTTWLPVDPAKLTTQDLAEVTKGVPLSQLLAGVATVVEQAFRQGVWTTAEVVRADGDPHVYLELAERDSSGTLVAKARAIVWARDVERVLGMFQQATGVRVAAGIKVLVRARPEFSAQYGLTLHIDAIDPSYTLGDLEAKKRQIREQLKAEGIFERNRQLAATCKKVRSMNLAIVLVATLAAVWLVGGSRRGGPISLHAVPLIGVFSTLAHLAEVFQ